MGVWSRWAAAVLGALAAFGIVWWVLKLASTDTGTALALAAVPFAIVLTVGGAWADRARSRSDATGKSGEIDIPNSLRNSFAGHSRMWQEQLRILTFTDHDVDGRHALMRQVQTQSLETLRLMAEVSPGAPILGPLAGIARKAGKWARYRVYIDGGRNFDDLETGCGEVLDAVQQVLTQSWQTPKGYEVSYPTFRSPDEAASQIAMRVSAGYRDWVQLRDVAVANPPAAVLLTWKLVHFLVYAEAYREKAVVQEDWAKQLPLIASRLGATRHSCKILEDLRDQRDSIEEGEEIGRSEALEYIDVAETILRDWLGDDAELDARHRYGNAQ